MTLTHMLMSFPQYRLHPTQSLAMTVEISLRIVEKAGCKDLMGHDIAMEETRTVGLRDNMTVHLVL